MVDLVGDVISGTSSGGLQLAQFLMGIGEKILELSPGLVGWIP